MAEFDSNKYWKERHKKLTGNATVGQKSFSFKGNDFLYRIVIEQYRKLLDEIITSKKITVLDAGAGIGIFTKIFCQKGLQVTAVDLSQESLMKLKESSPDVEIIASPISQISQKKYDIVHSFDVLYHITDKQEWERSLVKLASVTKNYLILHQRFLERRPLILPDHINFYSYSEIEKVLRSQGLTEVNSIPTHVIALRVPTYLLANLFPSLFYRADHCLVNTRIGKKLGSHYIKVFKREKDQGII